jgi:hypothetical protein
MVIAVFWRTRTLMIMQAAKMMINRSYTDHGMINDTIARRLPFESKDVLAVRQRTPPLRFMVSFTICVFGLYRDYDV